MSKFTLDIIVVGAGLGGLGAAIALLLAGHSVLVLESAHEIAEVGAGIQILPNASRILKYYGLEKAIDEYGTRPKKVNMIGWKGNTITSMDFHEHAKRYNQPFVDFHRADLHKSLLERALELGATVKCNSRVDSIRYDLQDKTATVVTTSGKEYTADLVIGADGINSHMRELLVGKADPPTPTGDLAYRLLINTEEMLKDPELAKFVTDPQVCYWMGPKCHVVNYILKGGEKFNMVLLCPDDIPADATTVSGNVEEMRNTFRDWDPRIYKLLGLCDSVYKWKLCIRLELDNWTHPSNTMTLLGDSVHATLPYLASGAGMAIEDGAVLGECLRRIGSKEELGFALRVYENCRRSRTTRIVSRGSLQQTLYHLEDGEEQKARDRHLSLTNPPPGDPLPWRDCELAPWLLGYDHIIAVDETWPEVTADLSSSHI